MCTVVWLREELRLEDNPALQAAGTRAEPVIPLFILDTPWQQHQSPFTAVDDTVGAAPPGAASQVWLHYSLLALQAQLRQQGVNLILARGDPEAVLAKVLPAANATALYWSRACDPWRRRQDEAIQSRFAKQLEIRTFNASQLLMNTAMLKDDGTPYRVFTPYWNRMAKQLDQVQTLPRATLHRLGHSTKLENGEHHFQGLDLEALKLLPQRDWGASMISHWTVGEVAALDKAGAFVIQRLEHYPTLRDIPARHGSSELSPHLHFGEIGPRQLVKTLLKNKPLSQASPETVAWIRQLAWREFAHYSLMHQPRMQWQSIDARFHNHDHESNPELLERWRRGMSGIPLVDAGMRQLWATGWMHNRVRMVAASWLVKQMQQPWQSGEAWFRDTLVDADIANNAMGWQWSAGTGIDAAPYFRVFNPVLQGERFDRQGEYVRYWVPELEGIPDKHIHQPWLADVTAEYPEPCVSPSAGRIAALNYWQTVSG